MVITGSDYFLSKVITGSNIRSISRINRIGHYDKYTGRI